MAVRELEWIDINDLRLLRWIMHYSSLPQTEYRSTPWIEMPNYKYVQEHAFYSFYIETIDFWPARLGTKRSFLSKMKSAWADLLQKDKNLAWLDKKNISQIKWAWVYLKESLSKNPHFSFPWNKYNPTDIKEYHPSIVSIFDTWRAILPSYASFKIK